MKKLTVAGKIITKTLEIFHWVCAGFLALFMLLSYGKPGTFDGVTFSRTEYDFYGIHVALTNSVGEINPTALYLFMIAGAILCILYAVIFRNTSAILKKAVEGAPFHKDNIFKLREIGFLVISLPIVCWIIGALMRLALGPNAVELGVDVDLDGIIVGIVVLCLTQFFAYGAQLEKDVDGLV